MARMTSTPPLFLAREALRLGSDRQLRRMCEAGSLTRLARGVYVETAPFFALDATGRYRTRLRAVAIKSSPRAQFSHDSAAAEWQLPSIGPWPMTAHHVVDLGSSGSPRAGVRRHALGLDPDAVDIDGITVTSLARTVIDMAASTPFVRAVAMADRALRIDPDLDFQRALDQRGTARGAVKANSVIEFASPLAESPGESFARVQFLALGYPAPELQVEFFDEAGLAGTVDFYFRELDLIVEFDGASKYGAQRTFQRDVPLEQIFMREKAREDRLRRVVRAFARINWDITSNRHQLANHLRPFGLIERGRSPQLPRYRVSDVTTGSQRQTMSETR